MKARLDTELAAGDLLFERLDIRLLEEKEVGDAGDHAGLVPANDGNCAVFLHGNQEVVAFLPPGILSSEIGSFWRSRPPAAHLLPAKTFDPRRNFP